MLLGKVEKNILDVEKEFKKIYGDMKLGGLL